MCGCSVPLPCVRQPVEAANQSYPSDSTKAQALIAERVLAWEKGGDGIRRLVNAELSHFLLETKVRDGDKVVGLLIADRQGALVAASSEPDHYSFSNESWWAAIHAGVRSRSISAG